MESLKNCLATIGILAILGICGYGGFRTELEYCKWIEKKEDLRKKRYRHE